MTACPLDHTELRRDEDGSLVCSHGHEYECLPDPPPLRDCGRCVTHGDQEEADGWVICEGPSPAPYGQAVPRTWYCGSGVWRTS